MSLCDLDDNAVCRVCGRPARHGNVYRECRQPPAAERKAASRGPGTELKKLLEAWPLRIKASKGCPCNDYAAKMDEWGCDGCEQRIGEIVTHLRVQAQARGIPFLDAVGRLLVLRAIANARQSRPPE